MIGREPELARIDLLLARAREGRGGALVVRGEPGIGKTTLLAYAQEQAAEMRVLHARGVEAEAELAFSGLHELMRPLLGLLAEIPETQAAALRGALALGPPVDAHLQIAAGVLSLLALAAEQEPLLLLVDDAHWLDAETARALAFVARRLEHDPVLLLFGAREGDPRTFEPPGLDEVVLTGLAHEESVLLLQGEGLPGRVVDELHRATGGNPLALLELPRTLDEAQRSGAEPLAEPLSVTVALQAAFARRIRVLSTETQRALLVAAAEQSSELRLIARACATLGVSLAALDDAGELVSVSEHGVLFRHPLVRAAVYHAARAAERRAVHRAFADASGADGDAARHAWHLAAAALEPDEEVAAALEAAGYDAILRSGYLTASVAFERAAALSPEPEARARRLYRAALTHTLVAEGNRKLPLLERALEATRDEDLRCDILFARGTLTFLFDPVAGARLLLEDATVVERDRPDRALVMVATVATARLRIRGAPDALETARRAAELAERARDTDPFIPFLNAAALLVDGRLREALPLLEASVQPLSEEVERAFGGGEARRVAEFILSSNLLAQVLLATGDVERATRCLGVGLAWAASRGAAQAPWRMFAARLDYLAGRWAEATAGLDEAVRLARESGYPYLVWQAATGRAELAAVQGAEEELAAAETAAAEAEALWAPMASLGWLGGCGQALLALGHGRVEEAASIYRRALPLDAPLKLYPQTADAIEAFLRAGHTTDATSLLAEFTAQCEQARWPWARGRSAHLQALAESADDAFQRALELQEEAAQPFPRARTQLAYGEWLRRGGRRIDARTQLRAALETFEQLGAEPWAEQAGAELRATGERLRRRTTAALGELTPQELQVALVVAQGATNKEAAAQLYLSPKTIEKHLGSAYTKLAVRSRTELAAVFASKTAADAVPASAG